jgi:hypothetical protein
MTYNYLENVTADAAEYIRENYSAEEIAENILNNRDRFVESLNDEMWTADSVTGNGSGSYTFSTYRAEENICHNLTLLSEALEEFGCGPEYMMKNGPEACDVTIRCYLLYRAIDRALDELEEDDEIREIIDRLENDEEEEED